MPSAKTQIEYALNGDTLTAWTVAGSRVAGFRKVVDTAALFQTIRDVDAMEWRGVEKARPIFSALYEWFLRPLLGALEGHERLQFVIDERLQLVPFSMLYDSRRGRYVYEDHRVSFRIRLPGGQGTSSVVDLNVMRTLSAGRVTEALGYLDRARTTIALGSNTPQEWRVSVPAGEVAVVYSLVADTLLAWVVSEKDVTLTRTLVDTTALFRAVEEAERGLEHRAGGMDVLPQLSALYQWLLSPIESRLGNPGTPLVVVPEERLGSIPFAAMYDHRRGRFLVEDSPIRIAPSLEAASRKVPARTNPDVALITDPAFDPREHPGLGRLHFAREEVSGFVGGYPGATLLEGSRATRPAVDSALSRAGILHFAGHAVFDVERPDLSYLVLAARAGFRGRITAVELSQLDLRHVRLVVLAACRTDDSGYTNGSFVDAMLAAGAHGVLASTWNVDDRSTADLMIEFHRRYQRSRNGPQALREAQLALLHSHDPSLRSPSTWASFRYVGR